MKNVSFVLRKILKQTFWPTQYILLFKASPVIEVQTWGGLPTEKQLWELTGWVACRDFQLLCIAFCPFPTQTTVIGLVRDQEAS